MPIRILPALLLLLLALATAAQPASTADPAAQLVTKLFMDACIPNLGQPAKVRECAQAHQLPEVLNPTALGMFVGPGASGGAWGLSSPAGIIVLSIRGTTQACAVWAQIADPGEAWANFTKIVEGVRRPGIGVSVFKDEGSPSPWGEAHQLIYSVAAPGAPTGFLFTLLTAERLGGPFQVSMQAAQGLAK